MNWKINMRMLLAAVGLMLVSSASILAADGENLFADPSFEQLQDADQFGHVFKNWSGWVYEGTAKMTVGNVARTGKHSYGMIGEQDGKVRAYSPELHLDAGRYRVSCYVRGMGVGEGRYKIPMDFSVGFNNQFFTLAKFGTFGWTPVTYVFDVKEPTDKARLFVGLLTSGWVWIDDAKLEKVDTGVALTAEPVVGKEETPITPPGKLSADAINCPSCGYPNNHEWGKCYVCGEVLPAAASSNMPSEKIIADFEDGKPAPFDGDGKVVTENASHGKYALATSGAIHTSRPGDWTGYDYFHFDVFNPSESQQSLFVEIRDAQTKGYWTRVNYETVVPPGMSTITLPTGMYVGEKSRPGRPLIKDKITDLYVNANGKPLVFDNFRLERLDTSSVTFPSLRAFHFGLMNAPVMEGFTRVAGSTTYDTNRGYGWVSANIWNSYNVLQPDVLTQTFVCPNTGKFRVDLPNGKYHVIMNIDLAGGYWGELQAYQQRKVLANGKPVVDETMNIDSFKKKYFRNAMRDDLPGMDTFNVYVQKMFDFKAFDVDVTNGKLDLDFEGGSWTISLSSLVLYPTDKAEQGGKFWAWVTQRREAQFNDYFKQVQPKVTGAAAPANDYAIFSRNFMKKVNAFDGPQTGEGIPAAGLSLTVAQGEEMPVTFSVQPSGDVGEINVKVSELTLDGTPGKALAAGSVRPGWLDYRITRETMEGSVYTTAPRYWHAVPAPAAPKVTRTFWLRVQPPVGTSAGTYKGTISVEPAKGAVKTLPVTVTVLPFALDPITDVAAGPWGCSIDLPWIGEDPATAQWNWQMMSKSLDVIKAAGCTSFSGIPHVSVQGSNGKISLNTATADREMALVRSKGFDQLISSYGAGITGYQAYGDSEGPDRAAATAAGFKTPEDYLKALYSTIDEHAQKNNWVPVAWNLCDEPLEGAILGSIRNAQAHRKVAEGLTKTVFMGATSMEGADPKSPHYELVRALTMPSLNGHDEASLKVVNDAGNKFSFYNGGNRWTYGRYMKMLVLKHNLALRVSWHFNCVAGDPYYALDCREDDFCWFNTDAQQTMVPSIGFLSQIQPGLNDYRYLSTLQRLIKEKQNEPAAVAAKKVFDSMVDLQAGRDRSEPKDVRRYNADRTAITEAILSLLAPK